MSGPRERHFDVNGYRLAAQEWHPEAPIKVIALHGWLDNSASFDVLAPLLPDCHIIALDLPGQGLSEHKPPQASYNIWDDLLDILAVVDDMAWSGFHLLSHSRGAIMSVLLAGARPEKLRSLFLLDGIWPMPVAVEDSPQQLHKFLKETRALARKKLPEYTSLEDAIAARCKSAGMSVEAASPIVKRATKQRDGLYCWTSDPRLTTASAFKLSQEHIDAFVLAIEVPCELLLAEQGMGGYREVVERLSRYERLTVRTLPGSHHFHLEEAAKDIAVLVSSFFSAS